QRPDMAFHRMFRAVLSGKAFPLYGDGKQTRDFTFVNDAVSATIAASRHGRPGRVYNIGGGSRVSLLEVIQAIESVTGKTLSLQRESSQKGDMRDTYADTSSARQDLGYRPSVTLREGLEAQWSWLQGVSGAEGSWD
ncbi:MAG: NAD-dependent epimerase/dehydratase family protein, partial [Acidobacteriota bacterium]